MSFRGDNSDAGSVYGSAGGYSWFGGSLDDFEDPDFLPPPELLYPAVAAPVFRQARSRASTPSPPPPPVNRAREVPSSVALPPFRVNRPASWFDTVNDIFRLKGVRDQRDRLTFAVSFFAEEQLQQIDDLLELRPRPADIFDLVRDRLVGAHALDDYQLLELLLDLPPLGGQKPSALLAQIRQLCPTGEENTKFFRITFLRRLPPAVRSQLAEDRFSPVSVLAARADKIMVHHSHQLVAAAAEAEDPVVAAAATGGRPTSKGKAKKGRSDGKPKPCLKIGLCYKHYKYGAWVAEN
jgi:hypothetical protein